MQRYAHSRFRIVLLILMLGAAVITAGASFGQGATSQPASSGGGVFALIGENIDPIFIVIALLSIAGLTLIIQGFIQNRNEALMPEVTTQRIRELIETRQFKDLMDFTETDPSFISRAINPALKRAPNFDSMKEAMETALGEQTAEQFRHIEYLNIIGNLGPLLGLLGTVLGMIYSFQEVANKAGQADVAALSHGISKALTHTFLGLFLAVPCLAAFGVLRTMVDRLTVRGPLVAEELLLMMKPADPKPQQQVARPVAAPVVAQAGPPGPPRKIGTPAPGVQ